MVATTMDIMEAPIGASVKVDAWMTLIVASRAAHLTVLTSDGGLYDEGGWHTESDTVGTSLADGGWVYVERYSYAGRVFHGFIHPVSRKLTQSG